MFARPAFRMVAGVAVLAAAVLLVLTATSGASAANRPPVRIGRPPHHPAGSRVIGPLPSTTRLSMSVALKPRDPRGLASYATEVATPGSSIYRDYLTVSQFRQRFAPTDSEVSAVKAELRARRLSPGKESANGLSIQVTARAGAVARALSVSFERVHLPSGRVAYANTAAPQFPASIAGAIQGVIGLDSLVRAVPLGIRSPIASARHQAVKPRVVTGGPQACTAAVSDGTRYHAYTADQLASGYRFSNLYGAGDLGGGQTVALFELEPYSASDISAYQSCYGTSAAVTNVPVDGGAGSGAGSGEAALDVEDVAGLSPQASIQVYEGPNTGTGVYDTYSQIISDDVAKVISTSWGECEAKEGLTAAGAENTLFQEAATQGQSLFAAAGDSGSEDCGGSSLAVDDPASQPYVTSAGGTTVSAIGPPPSQSVWNDGKKGGAGGGGISSFWPMPSYQSSAAPSLSVINSNSSGSPCSAGSGAYCREVPDVSADADENTGYVIYYKGAWTAFGGTSAAAPLWAAFTALTNASSQCGGKPIGFANPALYRAAGQAYSSDFSDITSGNNSLSGGGLYPAASGYDMASGLGTPVGSGLPSELCGTSSPPAVTLTTPANGSAINSSTPTLSGAAGTAPGDSSTVTVKIYSGSSASGSLVQTLTTSQSAGSWSVTPLMALMDGTYTAQAQQTNSNTDSTGYSSPHTFIVDTAGPANGLSLTATTGAHLSGTTLYWNGNSAGGFELVDAVTDSGSGPASASFPAVGTTGWTHGSQTVTSGTGSAPTIDYTSSPYSWTTGAANPANQSITGSDVAGNQSATSLHFVEDTQGPSGGSVDATGLVGAVGRYSTSTTLSIGLNKGSDSQSGVSATGARLERASATLSSADGQTDGTCGAYSTYTLVSADPTSPYTDNGAGGIQTGHCYRYEYIVPDNVGNLTTYTSPDIKVQTAAPASLTPVLSLSNATGDTFISGSTVYTNPQAGRSGSFTVSATASDATSGISDVAFPDLSGYTGGGSVSSSPFSTTYSWSGTGATASGSEPVKATDNASLTATSAFTISPDTTAPTGSVSYATGSSTAPVSVTFSASDSGSGVDSTLGQLQRASAPLSSGSCGTFSSFTNIGPAGVSSPYSDPSVSSGNCYEYRYLVPDNVGNQAAIGPSGPIQVGSGGTTSQPPVASFTFSPTSPLTGQTVSFNGTGSSDPSGTISSYAWTFGDGGAASVATPTHTYSKPGTYTVQLTVKDGSDGVGTTTRSLTVSAPPLHPPALNLRIPRQRLRSVLRRGLRLSASSDQAASGKFQLVLGARMAKRLRLGTGAHSVVIASLRRQLAAGTTTSMRLKLTRKARHRLAGVRTIRLTFRLTATGAGGKTTVSRRLRLRR